MKTVKLPFDALIDEGCDFQNPRQVVDRNAIHELAASINKVGLLYPLQVWRTRTEEGVNVNIVIDGRRRLWAIKELVDRFKKQKKSCALAREIPCVLIDGKSLQDARIKALTGNIQRENLSTYEIAQEMLALKEAGMKGKDIATMIGKSGAWVSRVLGSFTKSSDLVRKAWRQGVVPDETVQALSKLTIGKTKDPDHEEQDARLEKILKLRTQDDAAETIAAGGSKKSKAANRTKARNVAKEGSEKPEKVKRPTPDHLRNLLTTIGKPKKTDRYLQGIADAVRFSLGELGYGEFGKELQDLAAAQLEAAKENK